jgi:hypothetical protein
MKSHGASCSTAHHLERRLLRVRQALVAGDVESFIRAVAMQSRHVFPAVRLPNLDRSIIAAAQNQGLPIGAFTSCKDAIEWLIA